MPLTWEREIDVRADLALAKIYLEKAKVNLLRYHLPLDAEQVADVLARLADVRLTTQGGDSL